ncbi:MAG: hypothetical protein ORN51_15075 [Akkermansiaceae bacterium]|nr:hypothetical protein [Akkermansiaceae bacterium]
MSQRFSLTHDTLARDLPMILRLAGIGLICFVWCQVVGWVLSYLNALNAGGYLASMPLLIASGVFFWRATSPHIARPFAIAKWWRRLKSSPALAAWSVISSTILIGAIAHAPSNYDALTYRLPRLLYWLQENHWHWIDSDHRQSISGVGFEWMMAPFIALTHSDRGLFLINFIPFLLLPGLFFLAACGLGIRRGVAKWWMWVWPMAFGIALQAGSIGNDLLPAALALASLAFAAQALRCKPWLCLFLSALAAASMTSVKATSIPLALPLGIYWLWVAWQKLGWRGSSTVILATIPAATLSSFLPIAFACTVYTGAWSGNPHNRHGAEAGHPVAGVIGNSIEIGSGLIQPPVFPGCTKANTILQRLAEEQAWYRWTKKNYYLFKVNLGREIPMEESAGVGLAITTLALIALFSRQLSKKAYLIPYSTIQYTLLVATAIALLAFMSKMGTGGVARLALPYIPLMLLCCLFGLRRQPPLKCRTNMALQLIPAAFLIPSLIFNPNRPLLPVASLASQPGMPQAIKERISSVYEAYQNRATILMPLQQRIPQGETIGFAGEGDHSALGLFKPYGSRKVIHLTPRSEDHLNWIIGTTEGLEAHLKITLAEWKSKNQFEKIEEVQIVSKASGGPETWFIYKRLPPKP